MNSPRSNYNTAVTPTDVRISGALRLDSVAEYERLLEPVATAIGASTTGYTIDICQLQYLNSAAITGLSRIVLQCRSEAKDLTLVGDKSLVWQVRLLTSLSRLYRRTLVTLV
jgi:hypothetical protein